MRHVLVLTRDIAAPPSVVWAVITDIDASPRTMRGIERVERTPGPDGVVVDGYRVGTSWLETRRVLGREASEHMRVTRVEPERSTVIEAEVGRERYVSAFHLDASGVGTTLTFEFSSATPRQSGARQLALDIAGALGRAMTRRIMEQDLDDIARAALEASGGGGAAA